MKWVNNKKDFFFTTGFTILCIVCFPANPLVLTGVIEVESYLPTNIIGGIVWAFGMVLVMAPIIMFPRHGGVPKGKPFVNTTRLVDTGIYSVVRHPQYLGGILAVFITTLLWYPHWLFGVLGTIGAVVLYMGAREEDQRLIQQFGEDYQHYIQKVPGMNILVGLIRLVHRSSTK